MALKFGCQTYTWQMSKDKYAGRIPHILDVVAKAEFHGFEPEVIMLGAYKSSPDSLAEELGKRELELGALCLALPWKYSSSTDEEIREVDMAIHYLQAFPKAQLVLVQLPFESRTDLVNRQANAVANINWTARRAATKGISCSFHPNSPAGSVFRTREDYEILFHGLDTEVCGYAPDTGHIAKGGMNVREILLEYGQLIRHIHFKDIDGSGHWVNMGCGVINHEAIVQEMKERGYEGWIMVEEESVRAQADPDYLTLLNGKYVDQVLRPLTM